MNNTPLPESKKPELKLVIWPEPCLKYAVAPFPEEELKSQPVRNIAGAMIRAMYKYRGVGLAAPQVSVPFRVFVMDAFWTKENNQKHPRVFLNPEITDAGTSAISLPHPGEGCLSFPYDYHGIVKRHDTVELQWLDFKGDVHHELFKGHEAIVIQHEMDHLNGYCFIDRLSLLKQDMAYRRAKKVRRRYDKGMKQGMKMIKDLPKSPEGLLDRNKAFEARRKAAIAAEDAKDPALVEARLAESTETSGLEEVLERVEEHSDWCHAKVRSGMVNECNCQSEEQR